ncbi:ras-domain-containing protein [Ramicandelaber brevisporus]|nr:ras-domain-containing protein [Ramicandelaber brevisporus]
MATPASVASEYKICLLGAGGVGKSALAVQYTARYFLDEYDPTIEDSYSKLVTVDGEDASIEIVDTAGQEEYLAMRDQYIRMCDGFLLVFSITSRSSFDEVLQMINFIRRIKDLGTTGSWPISVVGNKADLEYLRQIRTADAQAIATNQGATYIETSAKLRINVNQVFNDMVRMVRAHRRRAVAVPPTPAMGPMSRHYGSMHAGTLNASTEADASLGGGGSGPATMSKQSLSAGSAPSSIQPKVFDRLMTASGSSGAPEKRTKKISVKDIRRTDIDDGSGQLQSQSQPPQQYRPSSDTHHLTSVSSAGEKAMLASNASGASANAGGGPASWSRSEVQQSQGQSHYASFGSSSSHTYASPEYSPSGQPPQNLPPAALAVQKLQRQQQQQQQQLASKHSGAGVPGYIPGKDDMPPARDLVGDSNGSGGGCCTIL